MWSVDIVIPLANNLKLVDYAMTAQLDQILRHGCRVWRARGPFDHSKLFTIDGVWSYLGSSNIDPRSLRLNFELDVEVHDPALAGWIEARLHARIGDAVPETLDSLAARPAWQRVRNPSGLAGITVFVTSWQRIPKLSVIAGIVTKKGAPSWESKASSSSSLSARSPAGSPARCVRGSGFGILGNMVLGILGAFAARPDPAATRLHRRRTGFLAAHDPRHPRRRHPAGAGAARETHVRGIVGWRAASPPDHAGDGLDEIPDQMTLRKETGYELTPMTG